MDFDLLLDEDLFNILTEDSPRGTFPEAEYDAVDELIRDIPRTSSKCEPTEKAVEEDPVPIPSEEIPLPAIKHVPPTSAEAIMMNACATLRATGMRFISDVSTSYLTLEEFRDAFYGGSEGSGSDPGEEDDFDEDDEDNLNEKSFGSATKNNKKRKRATKRPNNPDADLIVSATEETMRLIGVDGNSREGKSQRRRIRNRMSAQLHRERKAMYIDALEAFVRIKETRITQLSGNVRQLTAENDRLRGRAGKTQPPEQAEDTPRFAVSVSGGSTTAESDLESLSSESYPGSPVHHDVEADFSNSSRRVRANNGTGINGGTGVRSSRGMARHFMPMLSVIVMFALCFTGENGGLQIDLSSSSSEAPPFRRELLELQSVESTHVSRRLMALPEAEQGESTSNIQEMLSLPSPKSEITGPGAPSSSSPAWKRIPDQSHKNRAPSDNSRALWKYTGDDILTTLYPRGIIIKDRTKNAPKERRNLRSRDHLGAFNDHDARDLVASTANALMTTSSSSEDSSSLHSHILVHSGKALLDPSMTVKGTRSAPAPTAHARYSQGGLPTIGAPGVHTTSGSVHGDPNMLTMLVPTSSIRWGKSWSESVAGTTEALLAGLDLSEDATPAVGEEMYVELVCSISSASLVKNATML